MYQAATRGGSELVGWMLPGDEAPAAARHSAAVGARPAAVEAKLRDDTFRYGNSSELANLADCACAKDPEPAEPSGPGLWRT